jgi:hypothetical protein
MDPWIPVRILSDDRSFSSARTTMLSLLVGSRPAGAISSVMPRSAAAKRSVS